MEAARRPRRRPPQVLLGTRCGRASGREARRATGPPWQMFAARTYGHREACAPPFVYTRPALATEAGYVGPGALPMDCHGRDPRPHGKTGAAGRSMILDGALYTEND